MKGSIAQMAALACFGNAFLAGKPFAPFFPGNSTCQFCDHIRFVVRERKLFGGEKERVIASTPDAWFSSLQEAKAREIRLWHGSSGDSSLPDRMSAAFVGGGGDWTLEVLLPGDQSEYWAENWHVWNYEAPERRIWRVDYSRFWKGAASPEPRVSLAEAHAKLWESLRAIHTFSQSNPCGSFSGQFAKAIEALESKGEAPHGYHRDLAPEGLLPPEALALFDACQIAWVFGGMGSWNDLSLEGGEYDRVSENLFQALNEAICAAANSSRPSSALRHSTHAL